MCLAFPGKIVSIDGQKATIDFDGVKKDANVSMVDVKIGDYVIVHAGFAIQTLTNEDAMEVLKEYEKADEKYRKNSKKN
ncbi:MAG: hydrogenase maturation factor [uncultured bacterium]|nr:MAG: hydrogenase maturation factor [uncultured bacterium]HBR71830.1 HypC/HybG/HupF family hydrogenase formation chaperone [Candidatus Moranbacteria bacterium]